MATPLRTTLLFVLLWSGLASQAGAATPGPCQRDALPSGAGGMLCVPSVGWNGQLFLYAHGYVAPEAPLDFYQLILPDGTVLPDLVQGLGFAFATTTYRENGLVQDGVADIAELKAWAIQRLGSSSSRTYLTGVSEGGLVSALVAERAPQLVDGAYATCGPVGDFRFQANYVGDFRVLFDYYFPDVLPGTVIAIPTHLRTQWEAVYVPRVLAALAAAPARALELLRVSGAPYDAADPSTIARTVVGLLTYNVTATNDARRKLGGNPFDNQGRWYSGSADDVQLNLQIQRFTASPRAIEAMAAYRSSGQLTVPLVTLHTTADEIVPFAHEILYGLKASPSGRGRFVPLPVGRYGHCQFTTAEVLAGFGLLVSLP